MPQIGTPFIRHRPGGRLRGLVNLGVAACGLLLLVATTADAGTTYYHYDGRGRLVSLCDTASGKRIRYQYDNSGNRTSWTVTTAACSANTPPVAVNDAKTGPFSVGMSVPVDVLSNDSDADGDDLRIMSASCISSGCSVFIVYGGSAVIGQPSQGAILVVTATTAGTKTISYTLSDGHGGTATATVTINSFHGSSGCGAFPNCMPF